MIGDNLPQTVTTADDARAYAAAINALRAEAERIRDDYKPHLSELDAEAKRYRDERDGVVNPIEMQMRALRAILEAWLAGDPDGNLRDGERIVATLARKAGKPQIHAEQVPDSFKTLAPDMSKINAALARGERVPGVVVTIETSLRVLS